MSIHWPSFCIVHVLLACIGIEHMILIISFNAYLSYRLLFSSDRNMAWMFVFHWKLIKPSFNTFNVLLCTRPGSSRFDFSIVRYVKVGKLCVVLHLVYVYVYPFVQVFLYNLKTVLLLASSIRWIILNSSIRSYHLFPYNIATDSPKIVRIFLILFILNTIEPV